MNQERECLIFCDESEIYSKFYGGVLVGSSQYGRLTARLNAEKARLTLFGEIKWAKVSANYVGKYEELMRVFFDELRVGHARVRIMFRQNAPVPAGLTDDQIG